MQRDWPNIFPTIHPEKMTYGIEQFNQVVTDQRADNWQVEGTLYCRGKGINRVGFAIRNTCVAWHFRDPEPLEVYRRYSKLGQTTEVTIKFKHGEAYDVKQIQKALLTAFKIEI